MKNNKRTRINTTTYTEGRNMFGEKCKTELIVLKREIALTQMLEAICTFNGEKKEYTFDVSCFKDSPTEFDELYTKVESFISLLAKANDWVFDRYTRIA